MKTTFPKRTKPYQEIIEEIAKTITEIGKNRIAYVILFGSFARGDFYETELKEESDGRLLKYISDYDFLILTKNYIDGEGSRARNMQYQMEQKIEKRLLDSQRPVSLIIEPLKRVNKDLQKGHYFFIDIKREGILLYKDDRIKELSEPKELSNEERKELAEGFYEEWTRSSNTFFLHCNNSINIGDCKNAAFQLHQATESLYQCSHLVFTNYSPKLHDIEKLNKPLIHYSKEFLNIFPQNNEEEVKCFDLLKRAYVEARYNKNYAISKEQLEYLMKRVEKLKEVTKKVCLKKIESFNY